MTRAAGIRLVTELQAERELLALGFTKSVCGACDGKGHYVSGNPSDWKKTACAACEGAAFRWVAPAREIFSPTTK